MLNRLCGAAGFGRLAGALLLLTTVVTLSGCRARGRTVKAEAPPTEFVSPIAPVGGSGMQLADIRQVLQDRRAQIKSAQAAMTLTIGAARSRGRQQFDATVYSRPATNSSPELLRVRGSADAGPVFDFLLNRNEVQAIVYPEKQFYRGSLIDLRSNPQLLAGVQPDDLAGAFLVERTLLQRIRENPDVPVQETPNHFIIPFQTPEGLTERFHVRKGDLLVEQIERVRGNELISSVRYFGYRVEDQNALIPTRYDITLATGAELSVNVAEVRFNGADPDNVGRMTVPEGFERLRL